MNASNSPSLSSLAIVWNDASDTFEFFCCCSANTLSAARSAAASSFKLCRYFFSSGYCFANSVRHVPRTNPYVIQATPVSGPVEKLFFDVRTGLLVRRYTESDTPLGKLPLQVDYEDYREVDGIKQPFLIHWSFPGRVGGRKIDAIKQNVPLDDAKFNPIVSRP